LAQPPRVVSLEVCAAKLEKSFSTASLLQLEHLAGVAFS